MGIHFYDMMEYNKRLNQHIIDMLSVASHDLRGPLNSIAVGLKVIQRELYGRLDPRVKEAIMNLSSRMNWMKTMNSLLSNGTDTIFECGAGDGLTRNARFIEGEFQSFSVDKLEKFFESAAGK